MSENGDLVERTEATCICRHKLADTGRNDGPIYGDLLIEVLCRLPPKIMMRCSCVCKGWYVSIHRYCVPRITPSLPFLGCIMRLTFSPTKLSQQIVGRALTSQAQAEADTDAWPSLCSTFLPHRSDGWMLAREATLFLDSSNGLMLLQHPSQNKYVVWNPTTKQSLSIPRPEGKTNKFVALAVEVKYEDPADLFKILTFSKDKSIVDVFSSQTCMWVERKVKYNSPVDDNTFVDRIKRHVYLHGRLFTFGRTRLLVWYTIGDDNVDVICDYVKLPGKGNKIEGFIGLCGGHLQYGEDDQVSRFTRIWMFNVDTSKWILMHQVSFQALFKHPRLVDKIPANAKINLLAFDPVSDDGLFIWTRYFSFCYYYKSGNLVSVQCSDFFEIARQHHTFELDGSALVLCFPLTQCVAPLVLSRIPGSNKA